MHFSLTLVLTAGLTPRSLLPPCCLVVPPALNSTPRHSPQSHLGVLSFPPAPTNNSRGASPLLPSHHHDGFNDRRRRVRLRVLALRLRVRSPTPLTRLNRPFSLSIAILRLTTVLIANHRLGASSGNLPLTLVRCSRHAILTSTTLLIRSLALSRQTSPRLGDGLRPALLAGLWPSSPSFYAQIDGRSC